MRRSALVGIAAIAVAVFATVPVVVAVSRPARDTGPLGPLERRQASPTPVVDVEAGLDLPRVDVGSALVADQATEDRGAVPVSVRIGAIGVDASVGPVGVSGSTTEVPTDVDRVGWFRFASRPGEPGSTLLLAHVSSATQGQGAFFRLRDLEPGAAITVELRDGTEARYRVIARRMYAKEDLPDRVFDTDGRSVLTLVTCGGALSQETGRYEDNVVIYAVA